MLFTLNLNVNFDIFSYLVSLLTVTLAFSRIFSSTHHIEGNILYRFSRHNTEWELFLIECRKYFVYCKNFTSFELIQPHKSLFSWALQIFFFHFLFIYRRHKTNSARHNDYFHVITQQNPVTNWTRIINFWSSEKANGKLHSLETFFMLLLGSRIKSFRWWFMSIKFCM